MKHEYYKVEPVDNALFTGAVLTKTEIPPLTWKGGTMSGAMWGSIVEFFRYAEQKFNGAEAVVRLFYRESDGTWKAHAFPQTISAARCTETGDVTVDPDFRRITREEGYDQFGTIHSHGRMSAFQSGTDHHDETGAPGLHVTIGKLDEKKLSFHARLVYRGFMFDDLDITDWVALEIPEQVSLFDEDFCREYRERLLSLGGTAFPAKWGEALLKPAPVALTANFRSKWDKELFGVHRERPEPYSANGYGYGYADDADDVAAHPVPENLMDEYDSVEDMLNALPEMHEMIPRCLTDIVYNLSDAPASDLYTAMIRPAGVDPTFQDMLEACVLFSIYDPGGFEAELFPILNRMREDAKQKNTGEKGADE
jgi:hypothetical protein